MGKRDQRSEWHRRAAKELPRPPFAVERTADAEASLAKLPAGIQQMYLEVMGEFSRTGQVPDLNGKPGLKPMEAGSPLAGFWRIAFGFDERERRSLHAKTGIEVPAYRVVFSAERLARKVIVEFVGPWSDAYRFPTYPRGKGT